MANENSEKKPKQDQGYFDPTWGQRVGVITFLELSYNGGIAYKDGKDAKGENVLIEHEQEQGDLSGEIAIRDAIENQARQHSAIKRSRHARRKRVAAYENLVRPIVDKFTSYLLRTSPKRADTLKEAIQSRRVPQYVEMMVQDGLKLKESWIGVDSARLENINEIQTQQQLESADPKNKGKPYIVMADPRRIVDWEETEDGVITRVVIQEINENKPGFTTKATATVTFVEWTATTWNRYREVDDDGNDKVYDAKNVGMMPTTSVSVKWVEGGTHKFGACPWHRFSPSFPIEDLCELNRALFNMSSLLDEEMYQATFTQRWVTGMKPADLQGAVSGTQNWIAIKESNAKVGTIGATPGQADALMKRCQELRDSIYAIVSMESTTKNVAEAAEKKKRDLESLYTSLVKITVKIEQAENWLINMLGLAGQDSANASVYDRKFDVNSLSEFIAELKELIQLPFVPASVKREVAKQLIQKVDPFGDHEEYAEEADEMMDISKDVIEGVISLKDVGMMTPELAAEILGVPKESLDAFKAAWHGHAEREQASNGMIVPGEAEDTGDTEDASGDEGEEDAPPEGEDSRNGRSRRPVGSFGADGSEDD